MDDEEWAMEYQTVKYGTVWRLVMLPEEGSAEEAVMSFQGVIYKKDLPPFNAKTAINKPNAGRYLRQSVTLCGLQTRLFKKGVKTVLGIHALMARSVPQDEMEACSMVSVDDNGESLLHMGNRYLMPKKDAGSFAVLPIPADIDPQGLLSRVAANSFVYTDDNHVGFFEQRKVPGSDKMRFEECKPVIFRAGDLVEAQVTFIILNLRDGKKKTAMVLQSLSLLDGSITQKSMVSQMLQREESVKVEQPGTLKRRVGYTDEETIRHQSHDGDDMMARPTIKHRVGYVHEAVASTAQRFSQMDIEKGKCISLFPFKDDFVQWKKFLASALQKTDIITATDNEVMTFSTKKDDFLNETPSSVDSPNKSAAAFFEEDSNGTDGKFTFRSKFADALPFSAHIPIYDTCDTDFCIQEHFNEISSLPLYKEGKEDLPTYAVVTVGHSLASYPYIQDRNLTAIQLNVLFIILHSFQVKEAPVVDDD